MDWYRKWLENRRDILKACANERDEDEIMKHTSIKSKSTLRKHLKKSLDSGAVEEDEGKYRTTQDGVFAKELLNEILIRVNGLEDMFKERETK